MEINKLIETLEGATENVLLEEEEKEAISEIIQKYIEAEQQIENLRHSHYWISRLNVDLMDTLKDSIPKETIREICNQDYAIDKLIKLTEE